MPGILVAYSQSTTGLKTDLLRAGFRQVDEVDRLCLDEYSLVTERLVILGSRVVPRGEKIQEEAGESRAATIDGFSLVIEGQIFNAKELADELKIEERGIARLLLRGYRAFGEDVILKLDGEFNIFIYDHSRSRLTVFVDHVASWPLYLQQISGKVVFGSEKKFLHVVSDDSRSPDPIGLLQPFVHVHNVGDWTFTAGLTRLQPGEIVEVEGSSIRKRRHEFFAQKDRHREAGAEDYLERWQNFLIEATSKRATADKQISISLSAGLDSRAIACSFDRDLRPIWARTWGVPESDEVKFSKQIAHRLGFHHLLQDPRDFLHSDVLKEIVWRTEGEIRYTNGISIFAHREMKQDCDYLAGGWFGDVGSGAHLRPFMFLRANRATFIRRIYQWYCQMSLESLARVFTQEFLRQTLPYVFEEFNKSYERFDDIENIAAHEYWDLFNRQTRMTISSMAVDSHMFLKIRPFVDRKYLEFTMSLPNSLRFGQNLYKSLIYRLGPEIRDIPNSNTNQTVKESSLRNIWEHLLANREKAVANIAGKAGLNYKIKRKVPADDVGEAIRRDLAVGKLISEFLTSEYCDGKIFNVKGIDELTEEHYEGRADHSIVLARIATLAAALPQFVYEPSTRPPIETYTKEA